MTTWESPRGALLTQVEMVDTVALAELYATDGDGDAWARADAKTRRAWQLGYRPAESPQESH